MWRPRVLIPFAFALALAACGESTSDDFDGSLEPFLTPPQDAYRSPPSFELRGKVLIIDLDNLRLDPAHDRLPDELRARNPGEVGAVGHVRCKITETGTYGLWTKAYGHDCDLLLFDVSSGEIILHSGPSNSPPRRVRLPFWSRTASRPNRRIVDAIVRLQNGQ